MRINTRYDIGMNGIIDGWIHGSGEENTIDLDLSAWIGVREKWIVDRSDIDASDRIEIDIHQYIPPDRNSSLETQKESGDK